LIQEGSWRLLILWDSCELWAPIIPPPYCSGCEDLRGTRISDVECYEGPPDTWSFDIFIPGDPTETYEVNPGNYTFNFNSTYTIGTLPITDQCIEFEIYYPGSSTQGCRATFTVCPPKPCSSTCGVEARIEEVFCSEMGDGSYYVKLDANNTTLSLCYKVWKINLDKTRTLIGSGFYPANHTFGPYAQGSQLEFSIFPCNNPSCFKMLYVPYPIVCEFHEPHTGSEDVQSTEGVLEVLPNPFSRDMLIIKSPYPTTELEIYNVEGTVEYKTSFEGNFHRLHIDLFPGVYILRYRGPGGGYRVIKLIRL